MTDILAGGPRQHEGPDLDAATVVVLRDGGDGLECLMLSKTPGQSFGGLWVFPGGRVESQDGAGMDGTRRCAVREVAEETGLSLDPADLVPVSHWTPPPEAPKRFLTWFFVTALPSGAPDVVIDGTEIRDHVWMPPVEVLGAHARQEIRLLPPTWITLHRLRGCPDVAAALRAACSAALERFATRMVDDEGVMVALWHPDAAYPDGNGAAPASLDVAGPRHRLYMDPAGWSYLREQ